LYCIKDKSIINKQKICNQCEDEFGAERNENSRFAAKYVLGIKRGDLFLFFILNSPLAGFNVLGTCQLPYVLVLYSINSATLMMGWLQYRFFPFINRQRWFTSVSTITGYDQQYTKECITRWPGIAAAYQSRWSDNTEKYLSKKFLKIKSP
jgi:hypothetical protein